MKVSVVIPVFNEERVIGNCLQSLSRQTIADSEIIVVDDGSTDQTVFSIKYLVSSNKRPKIALISQDHQGPGVARNLGASRTKGEILVFVDADMEFDKNFISKLIAPIVAGKTIGTFSKDEYLLNKDNVWARCWNLNLGRDPEKMEPRDYAESGGVIGQLKNQYKDIEGGDREVREKNKQHVFRAILKSKFDEAGGFDTNVGYTDDWSLSRKLGELATVAPGAKYYHRNPSTLAEVWIQARWFGKNEFLTGSLVRKFYNLIRYDPLLAVFKGVIGSFRFSDPRYFAFKIVYDSAVFTSVLLSFWGESKIK